MRVLGMQAELCEHRPNQVEVSRVWGPCRIWPEPGRTRSDSSSNEQNLGRLRSSLDARRPNPWLGADRACLDVDRKRGSPIWTKVAAPCEACSSFWVQGQCDPARIVRRSHAAARSPLACRLRTDRMLVERRSHAVGAPFGAGAAVQHATHFESERLPNRNDCE